MSFVSAIKLWIWASVFATFAGWTLSLFGALNRIGYSALIVVALIACFELRNRGLVKFESNPWRWQKIKKIRMRFSRSFPLMFAALAAIAFLGGVLYPPTNHTGLSYRIPRVLNWIEVGHWHWIYAPNLRMNTRACGIEWMSVPFFLFFKSDRGLFLLNFIPFIFVPGLLFSMLRRLGVRGRVAWSWMWLLPTGYVFLLQAGSAGNDAFPIVYALAAVDFACRAWVSRRASDIWYSMLAIALLTGAKASNLPLCLMWLVLVAPLWNLMKNSPIGTSIAVVLALVVSFLPTALLNLAICGSWSALKFENAGMDMKNPFVGVWGNPLILAINNLCPPFFPMAGWWNQHSLGFLPGPILQPMLRNFETGFQMLWELPTEDWAGIGLGVTALMMISAWKALPGVFGRSASRVQATPIPRIVIRLTLISPWVGLLAYCAKSGMVTPARLIAPYYPLLLPWLIVGAEQSSLVRKYWWRVVAWIVFLMAFVVLIVTPPRPLWPAKTLLSGIASMYPQQKLVSRALATYNAYSIRWDTLAGIRAMLPPDLAVVGFLGTGDDLDISLWRPFGTRRVAHIGMREESAEMIRARKLTYAVVSDNHFKVEGASLDEWLTKVRAEVVTNTTVTISVSTGPQIWYIVKFKE